MADRSLFSIRALRMQAPGAAEAAAAQQRTFAQEAGRLNCLVRTLPRTPGGSGLLDGVPLAHKDVFAFDHHPCAAGGQHQVQAASRPAHVLAQLAAAGAIHMGALTLAEWCCGATGENRHHGRPVNPVHPRAVVGGSSSGSAAAVAAGLCAASLGTDTAGSIRIPAATCGVLGLKPTSAALSTEGVFPLAPSLDTVGMLAASAMDAAHVWTALCAAGRAPPAEASDRIASVLETAQPWRIAISEQFDAVARAVADPLALALTAVSRRWSTKERTIGPAVERLHLRAQLVLHAESASQHLALLQAGCDDLPDGVRAVMLPGLVIPSTWYAQALHARRAERDGFLANALGDAGILLTPALPRPVPDWDQVTRGSAAYDARELLALHAHFPFVNYLGLPAVVFPVGRDGAGRPVSLQAIARPGEEMTLLAFAHQVMRETGSAPKTLH